MTSQPRPVWITREEMSTCPPGVRKKWFAAPADAAEALWNCTGENNRLIAESRLDVDCLLRALGYPHTEQEPGTAPAPPTENT